MKMFKAGSLLMLVLYQVTLIVSWFMATLIFLYWLDTNMEKALGVSIALMAVGLIYARLFAITMRNYKTAKGEKQ